MSRRPEPKAHQVGDVQWIGEVSKGLLANEPGLGKSRSALDATAGARTLIIAPNLILSSGTWDDEIAKWSDTPELYTQAPYSRLNLRKAKEYDKDGEPLGPLNIPVKVLPPDMKERFDAVIIDEAHYVKGRKTLWTWAVEQIARPCDIVLPMTGTPIPNWSHELFNILRLIYPEEAKRGTGALGGFWRWAGEWFDTRPTLFSNGKPSVGELLECSPACLRLPADNPCQHYLDFAEANLGKHYRRMLRADCLDLPEFTESTIQVPMSTAQRRIYNQVKKDFATTINGQEVLAWSQGAKNNIMDLATVSPWLLAPEGPPRGGKFDQLKMDLELRTRPTLVLAHHRSVVEACAQVAGLAGRTARYIHGGTSERQDGESVAAFRRGEVDVLVGSLETVSEGLTLTVADTAIFVEKSYKPSRNEQATFRIYRLGQELPVTILDYVTPNSVDSGKRRLLATKTDRQMRMLTAAELMAVA